MKDNFDDIIKRRWEERQFPVDETHRQDMAKLLEGDNKRRGFIFWWLGSIAVVSVVAGYLLWTNMHSSPEPAKSTTQVETGNIAIANESTSSAISNAVDETSAAKVEPASSTNSMLENENGTSPSNAKSNIPTNTSSSKGKNNKSTYPKSIKTNDLDTNTAHNQKINNQKDQGIDKTITQQQGTDPLNTKEEIPEEGYKVELENPNQATIASKEAAIRVFPDSLEYDPWTNAIYRDGTVRSLNITKPIDDLNISEVENLNKPAPGEIKPHTKMTHPVYFIAETGIGLVLASKPYYDGGIKFNVGGGLGMRLAPKVHLQLTGGYQMQDGGFDFQKTSTVNTLGFGLRSQFNTLQPDRLHFVYGKLGAAYRFGRSTLDSHVGIQWLYGSQGNITRQEQSQVPPGHSETTEYAWLNTDGLRKTQYWWDVSYGYMIFPRFYIHGGASYYFTSLTEADVPENPYTWKGKTAKVQPFVTIKYLLHANF